MRKKDNRIDFHYYVDIEYGYAYNCGPECDPYCRCGQIIDIRFEPLDKQAVARRIIEKKKIKDELTRYVVERFCSRLTEESFEVDVVAGYYGQEIGGIYLDWQDRADIEYLIGLDAEITIKELLKREYGYLLDRLKTATFEVVRVNLSDVQLRQDEYARKVSEENLSTIEVSSRFFPVALCEEADDGKYAVIDGYHRVAKLKDTKKRKVFIVVASERKKNAKSKTKRSES